MLDIGVGCWLGKKNPPLLGLDISMSGIRLVELSRLNQHTLRLERYASEPLPPGVMVDGNIENIEQLSEAVQRVLTKSGSQVKHVALGIPSASVITTKIALPAGLPEEELAIQVELEAGQYIPFPLDDASLDFCEIGLSGLSGLSDSSDEIEVLVAAARKEKVEDRAAVAEVSGLKPIVMDIESYAARAAFERLIAQLPQAGQDKIIALCQIDVHAQTMHVSILLNQQSIFEHEQAFGSTQSCESCVENAAMEVARILQFFFDSTSYQHVDQLFLAGTCAVLPGLVEGVENRTQIKSTVVNPFAGMKLAKRLREKQLSMEAPAYLVACGLALRRFD